MHGPIEDSQRLGDAIAECETYSEKTGLILGGGLASSRNGPEADVPSQDWTCEDKGARQRTR